jgi:hypothetical protein
MFTIITSTCVDIPLHRSSHRRKWKETFLYIRNMQTFKLVLSAVYCWGLSWPVAFVRLPAGYARLLMVTYGHVFILSCLLFAIVHCIRFFLTCDQEWVLIFWRLHLEGSLKFSFQLAFIISIQNWNLLWTSSVCSVIRADLFSTEQRKMCVILRIRYLCLIYSSFVCVHINVSNYVMFEIAYLWVMIATFQFTVLVYSNALVYIDMSVSINCGPLPIITYYSASISGILEHRNRSNINLPSYEPDAWRSKCLSSPYRINATLNICSIMLCCKIVRTMLRNYNKPKSRNHDKCRKQSLIMTYLNTFQ